MKSAERSDVNLQAVTDERGTNLGPAPAVSHMGWLVLADRVVGGVHRPMNTDVADSKDQLKIG